MDYVLDKLPDGGDLIDDYKGGETVISGNFFLKSLKDKTGFQRMKAKAKTKLPITSKGVKTVDLGFKLKLLLGINVNLKIGVK